MAKKKVNKSFGLARSTYGAVKADDKTPQEPRAGRLKKRREEILTKKQARRQAKATQRYQKHYPTPKKGPRATPIQVRDWREQAQVLREENAALVKKISLMKGLLAQFNIAV